MKNYIQPGDVVTLTAPADVDAGVPIANGMLVGVTITSAANGAPVECATLGVYDLAKTSGQAWTVGQPIYLIPSTRIVTTATTAGNILIGSAAEVVDSGVARGKVRLNGSAPAAAE